MVKVKTPSIKELLNAGVHYGHQVRRWHPKMEPYIYTAKKNIHIIDLEKTEVLLQKACEKLFGVASSGGQVIFVGTKKQAREIIENEAKRCGAMYVTERWLGGTLTNLQVIRKNMTKLLEYKRKKEAGEFAKYTKKERLLIDREISRLERYVGGIVNLKKIPDAIVVIDSKREKTAVREANRQKVPVVGLVDTNCDPTDVDYVIPGNDDAIKSIAIIVEALANAVELGYKEFAKLSSKKDKTLNDKKSEEIEDNQDVSQNDELKDGDLVDVTSDSVPETLVKPSDIEKLEEKVLEEELEKLEDKKLKKSTK